MIYTIGHSTLPYDRFISVLGSNNIDLLVDVRSTPYSKFVPQFNKGKWIFPYLHIPELGGYRKKLTNNSNNKLWQHPSFRNYADYTETKTFDNALKKLINLSKEQNVAIMCAEGDWHKCHRRIISDYLYSCYVSVTHMTKHGQESHQFTAGAYVKTYGKIDYRGTASSSPVQVTQTKAGTSQQLTLL